MTDLGLHAGLCPYGLAFAAVVVSLAIAGLDLYIGKKKHREPISIKKILLLAFFSFAILAIIDVPTVLGRCPGDFPIEPVYYTLTINIGVGGSTNPVAGTYVYSSGIAVEVVALPDNGFLFDRWDLDGASYGANPIIIAMFRDYTLTPVFIEDTPTASSTENLPEQPSALPPEVAAAAASLSAFAFGTFGGIITFFSPCGLPLFPSYIAYYMGSKRPSLGRGISGGSMTALGAALVLLGIGLVVSVGGEGLGRAFVGSIAPLEIAVGAVLVLMGIIMMKGLRFPIFKIPFSPGRERGSRGFFLFGVGWSIAAMSCSAPVLLSVLLYSLTLGSGFLAFPAFIGYALGMAAPILIVSSFVATARKRYLEKIVNIAPKLSRVGAIILIVFGVYMINFVLWYGR